MIFCTTVLHYLKHPEGNYGKILVFPSSSKHRMKEDLVEEWLPSGDNL